jgi:hypothetical protein
MLKLPLKHNPGEFRLHFFSCHSLTNWPLVNNGMSMMEKIRLTEEIFDAHIKALPPPVLAEYEAKRRNNYEKNLTKLSATDLETWGEPIGNAYKGKANAQPPLYVCVAPYYFAIYTKQIADHLKSCLFHLYFHQEELFKITLIGLSNPRDKVPLGNTLKTWARFWFR